MGSLVGRCNEAFVVCSIHHICYTRSRHGWLYLVPEGRRTAVPYCKRLGLPLQLLRFGWFGAVPAHARTTGAPQARGAPHQCVQWIDVSIFVIMILMDCLLPRICERPFDSVPGVLSTIETEKRAIGRILCILRGDVAYATLITEGKNSTQSVTVKG